MVGTIRYASINTHLGIAQSRRDDMESLGFILMYFLRGSLPWQDFKDGSIYRKDLRVLKSKQQTYLDQLCEGYPAEFRDYFVHCSSLLFEDRPDYDYLKRMFLELYRRQGFEYDGAYDWDVLKREGGKKKK